MTVMIPEFFGLPHSLVREGKLERLNGAAVKVLVALWHESERLRTRELMLTDRRFMHLAKVHRNSVGIARRELKNAGLLTAEPFGPKGFLYELCDPATGKPWPGPPNVQIKYVRKSSYSGLESRSHSHHNQKTTTNKELAGVNFPFGHNAPEAQVSEHVSKAANSSEELQWGDIGSRMTALSPARKLCK